VLLASVDEKRSAFAKSGQANGELEEKAGPGGVVPPEMAVVPDFRHEEFDCAKREVTRRMELSRCLQKLDAAVATKSLEALTEAIEQAKRLYIPLTQQVMRAHDR
jgi:hypothetical protein